MSRTMHLSLLVAFESLHIMPPTTTRFELMAGSSEPRSRTETVTLARWMGGQDSDLVTHRQR